MIKFTLKCDQDHSFESWFQSGDAFEALAVAGHVTCAICGSKGVKKSMMAPRVRPARNAVDAAKVVENAAEQSTDKPMALSTPQSKAEIALAEMRKQVEDNSDYVGSNFVKEAREMHLGDAPERSIYGTAGVEEAKALIEDGVPVMPLPFIPKESAN
jgi:hypothetical protein